MPPPLGLTLLLLLPLSGDGSARHQDEGLGLFEARLFQVTSGGNIRGDLLIGVPVSFLFPSIGFNTEYKRKRMDHFQKRSIVRSNNWKRDPLLSRLDLLFESLGVGDFSCQQKLICELGRDHQNFSPLRDLVTSIFSKSSSTQLDPFYKSSTSWEQLSYSFHIGNTSKHKKACSNKFTSCTFDLPQLINIPILQLWQLASNYIDIRLDDN